MDPSAAISSFSSRRTNSNPIISSVSSLYREIPSRSKNGYVYVNGKKLEEPYIKEAPNYVVSALKLPEDHYFVLGDNRTNSNDSHNGWTIQKEDIVGKAWLRILAAGQLGSASKRPYRRATGMALDDMAGPITELNCKLCRLSSLEAIPPNTLLLNVIPGEDPESRPNYFSR